MTVFNQCATVITVESLNSASINFCIFRSVSMSIFEVASSMITILFLRSIAQQIQINYFSPELKFSPFSFIMKSICFEIPAFNRRPFISESVAHESGSRLKRTVPLNKTGIWGMIVILSLRSESPIVEMSTPSIIILPPELSMIRQIERQSVDFPAPVRPTTPIFSPALMCKFNPQSTSSVSSQYRIRKFSNFMSPFVPKFGSIPLILWADSYGMSSKSKHH